MERNYSFPKKSMHLKWIQNQYVTGFIASMSVMVGATCVAWVAPILPRLLRGEGPLQLTTSESSWMVSLIEVGPFFTPTLAGILSDRFGRKPCINFSVFLYFLSWILIIYVYNVYALYCARILQGMGLGITFTIVPMYLGEIAEDGVRGGLTTLFQTMFHAGLVFEYSIGPYLSYKTVAYVSATLPLIFFAFFFWLPESPYYNVMRNKDDKALTSLRMLHGSRSEGELNEDLKGIKASVEEDRARSSSWKDVVGSRADRKALFLVVVVTVTKACSGFLAILSYATQAFSVTEHAFLTPDQYTILIGVIMTVVAILSTPFVDSLGRRPLILVSSFGCFLCNFFVGCFYLVNEKYDLSSYGYLTFVGLALFSVFFSFGLGPVVLTLQSELFPSNTKGIASSICALSFTVSSFCCLKFYQVIVDNVGIYLNYLLFSMFCLVGFLITLVALPETKGKSFVEIRKQLSGIDSPTDKR